MEPIPHRREDGELLGWIRAEADAWVAIDLLGREITDAVEWLEAEEALERHGIGYLADPWMLESESESESEGEAESEGGAPLRVRFVEVTPTRIVVKAEDFGDVARATQRFELEWPLPARLREPRDGDPDGFTFG